jgi:hypothetical protein
MIHRRSLLKAIPALLCAPAIVKASSLVQISPVRLPPPTVGQLYNNWVMRQWVDVHAVRNRNVLFTLDDYAGIPVQTYRGIPIRWPENA